MTFTVRYDKQPERFLQKLDTHIAERIIDKIDDILTKAPVPHDARSVEGEHGLFRIRVGRYRVLYRIDHEEKEIIVVKIDKRPRVY